MLAAIRGDAREVSCLAAMSALIRTAHLETNADLARFVSSPPSSLPDDLLRQLTELHQTGAWVHFEKAVVDLPADLRWLFESGAVTLRQLSVMHQALGATSLFDFFTAVRRGDIGRLPEMDAAVSDAIADALPTLRTHTPRIPIGQALAVAEPILSWLRSGPGVTWAQPAGSLRRGQESVGDIEIVVQTATPAPLLDALAVRPEVEHVMLRSADRLYAMAGRTQFGVRCAEESSAAALLLQLTGSHVHVDRLRDIAALKQLDLAPDGLRRPNGRVVATTEEELYHTLDLPYIPPELRETGEEIEEARRGDLPTLVEAHDILGDLHMHTHWSDGRDSLDAMVQACVDLGYRYMAITDHSPSSGASRRLALDDIERQAEAIARLREQFPQIAILHGCEVDILPDGNLDFPDRVLRRLDIVLASLHARAGHSPQQLLRRYLSAMLHPLVTIVTHPTNRLFPRRAGYELDYNRLFEAAVETRTILEIDGAPSHIDLNASLARQAVAAGAIVSIDSDAHAADRLARHMQIGLLTARRGRIEPRHVLNTRPLPEIRAIMAGKSGRSPRHLKSTI
jgi:DNA polymerase (family 10)